MLARQRQSGFTLVEVIVASALFVVIGLGFYQVYTTILETTNRLRLKNMALFIANSQIELLRNAPYDDIGLLGGLPNGVFDQTVTVAMNDVEFEVTRYIRSIDEPFDGLFGSAPQDLSPADNKAVTISVDCVTCGDFEPVALTARIAPIGLETSSSNGAMLFRVFDAAGQPIQGAEVHITNDDTDPAIDFMDTTNSEGELLLVDAPPGTETYQITVTKDGYSTERTYAAGEDGVLNPVKPNLTVAVGEIAQGSFAIDVLSDVQVSTVSPACVSAPNVGFVVSGSKLLSSDPDVVKFEQGYESNGAGIVTLSDIEWDTYTFTESDETYAITGYNPLNPIAIDPGQNEDILLVVEPIDPYMVTVTVLDSGSSLPVASSTVSLSLGEYDESLTTDVGVIQQTDWSSGGGQIDFENESRFYDQTDIDYTTTEGEIVLRSVSGEYVTSGFLISSSFDMGDDGLLRSFNWAPLSQVTGEDSLRFQIATNDDNASWNFIGPDGTSNTYYTASNRTLHSSHIGDRYLRYRAYLSTSDVDFSPVLSDAYVTFTSDCVPPGQVTFSGAPSTGDYALTVLADGYDPASTTVTVDEDHEFVTVYLTLTE